MAATGGRAETLAAKSIGSISIDSRELGEDALFVAIKGDRFDGHDFVEAAFKNGAVAALVCKGGAGDGRILVPDALEGLRDLARAARQRSRGVVVGVTGSVGKTTTKEAIRVVLSAAGRTHASIKSFNNHWGVPLMLAGMPENADFGVFEMGMSAAGEITPLTQLVRPHIAVITTIAPAHLGAFDSIDGIAAAKAEIFAGVEPGGTAVLNIDHEQAHLLTAAANAFGVRIVTYGFAPGADWHVGRLETTGDGSVAEIHHDGAIHSLLLNVPGRHMVANAVAAMAVAKIAGVEPDVALTALAGFGAQPGRGQKLLLGPSDKPLLLVDESYNANTASMTAALDVFGSQKASNGRKVLVLGDMLELGTESGKLHASLAAAVNASGADRVYLVGTHMAALAEALGGGRVVAHTQTAVEMADILVNDLAYGDAVMVKGSKGVGLAGIVDKIRNRFA
ncbi:UDP-N-acetylmuramoyl-tripeptide--D-alanyl-D-alanine ligase [Devosia limi DSM 17137]|uniref:UDP-N-acetylmuramoyl-tripeptide--D-alanyl-D-alanine ligase n=1 Tax=Devosia limi DSM 17137 TaxID=1121477 RepID=A0A1M4YH23_9HYPH|nr:UDP-N-acetylmuramoyl-tripeptide--D-alanyl-D-alanine ligase [Devosia limi DSM 17137]